ncbi:hypothetical protein HMPREF1531_00794 [Propionibacterium sp. oral taxon 192 str. F0372]|nr:hypothetical protein HMPREF1531_00794 [Propionibacterium sp. oral taxon 192 str. F0372]
MGEVRGRGGAPRLERERRLTGPAVRGDDGGPTPFSPGRLDRGAGRSEVPRVVVGDADDDPVVEDHLDGGAAVEVWRS